MRLLLTVIALALLAASGNPIAAHGDSLKLNEILAGPARDWDGSGAFSSRDDEWIEVVNTGGAPLALAGYFVTDGDSIPRFAFDGTLDPGVRLLVTGKASYDWERSTGHPAFGLSLGNSGDSVILWKATGPDTVEVDRYTYKSHEAAADRAVGRGSDGGPAWMLFDGLNAYTGSTLPAGTGCMPSPAAANTCGSVPARPASWGRVKALYR